MIAVVLMHTRTNPSTPKLNACALILSHKLWLLITRQIDFINHPGNGRPL